MPDAGLSEVWHDAKANPLAFFENLCITKDEAQAAIGGEVYKPLPAGYPHILYVVAFLFDLPPFDEPGYESNVIDTWKGRQEIITWLLCCAIIYMCLFRPGCRIGTCSTKEKKAAEHLNRIWDVLVHMPGATEGDKKVVSVESPFGIYVFEYKESKGLIICKAPGGTESHIHALAASPRESRQYTFTWIWMDEPGAIQGAGRFYGAARPTVNKPGCKIILTGTPSGEDKEKFFTRLSEGLLEVS